MRNYKTVALAALSFAISCGCASPQKGDLSGTVNAKELSFQNQENERAQHAKQNWTKLSPGLTINQVDELVGPLRTVLTDSAQQRSHEAGAIRVIIEREVNFSDVNIPVKNTMSIETPSYYLHFTDSKLDSWELMLSDALTDGNRSDADSANLTEKERVARAFMTDYLEFQLNKPDFTFAEGIFDPIHKYGKNARRFPFLSYYKLLGFQQSPTGDDVFVVRVKACNYQMQGPYSRTPSTAYFYYVGVRLSPKSNKAAAGGLEVVDVNLDWKYIHPRPR